MYRWVVLSDLHFTYDGNGKTKNMRDKLIEKLREERDTNGNFQFVLITGDIMYKHSVKDCTKYLKDIINACGVDKEHLFITPGNHDINRDDTKRNNIIDKARNDNGFPDFEDDTMMGYDRFGMVYFSVKNEEYSHFSVYESKSNMKYRIVNIDSCLLSKDDKDKEKLKVTTLDFVNLKEQLKNDEFLNIAIMHHGNSWLESSDSKTFQHCLTDFDIDIVFCGHEHEAGLNNLSETDVKEFTCGCAMFDNKNVIPAFYICETEASTNISNINIKLYTFRGNDNWDIDSTNLRSFPQGKYSYKVPRKMKKHETNQSNDLIFSNLKSAKHNIVEDIKNSKTFRFFGLRGSSFVGEKEGNDFVEAFYSTPNLSVKLLVSYPYSDEVRQRLQQIPSCVNEEKLENKWKKDYDIGLQLRDKYKNEDFAEVRYHDEPLIFRLMITDANIYMSYYEPNIDSINSRVYCFTNNTDVYNTYLGYFDYLWRKSIRTLPSSIPAKYSFLEDKKFFVAPSLVVNVTSQCNMKCKYCPEGGENLNIVREEDLCSEATLKRVVEKFAKIMHDIKKSPAIIRITGGEPFVNSSCIHKTNGILTSAQHYDKIVLCTNGVELKKAYECNRPIWNAVKKQLLLKISLDTLDKKIYEEITGKDYLDTVKEAIKFANDMGYRIELNVVASKINIRSCEDIIKIFDYARSLGLVGIKILTVNNFGGNVDFEQSVEEKQYINKILEDLILLLRKMDLEERNVYLNDNKGIMMKRFVAVSSKTGKECTLTIVDHNSDNSITPQRTFGDICKECKYYCENSNNRNKITCATGLMSLTLRADGLLSPCRLKMEQGVDVKDLKTGKQIENAMKRQIAFFENGYHKGS